MAHIRRILVIDDNKAIHADFRKVFASIRREDDELDALAADLFGDEVPNVLERSRHVLAEVVVDSAFQGEEGIRMVVEAERQARHYDMAFVDVRMPPGIDGVQTISRLWQQVSDLQCVICTAFSDYDWEEIVRQLGMSGNLLILKKPFDAIEVLQLAQSLAEKSDLTRATRAYQQKLERQIQELTSAQTNLRRSNKDLEAARIEAEVANHAKTQFLANMSHELRTPLNAVIGMTELLLDTTLDSQQRKFARTVRTSGAALLELIDEILDFSKIEAGKLELEQIEFDLLAAIESVIDVVAHSCRAKELDLAYYIDPRIPRCLRGDVSRVRQIITNLVNNAIKFTECGEVMVRVQAPDQPDERITVKFLIEDTGIGIAADRLDRLFQSFSQVDASTTRKYGGTGLGLAICKQLCELMGGEIGVESEPGRGSTFWLTLPFEIVGRNTTGASVVEKLENASVLIIDRHVRTSEVLADQLRTWGVHAVTVAELERALKVLHAAVGKGKPFDVVLMEKSLIERAESEWGAAIKDHLLLERTALVALVPLHQPIDASQLREAGINYFLTKPVMQSELHNILMDVLYGNEGPSGRKIDPRKSWPRLPRPVRTGVRILLAEDNKTNQAMAAAVLNRLGYVCDVVSDGRHALEALQQHDYDLVLMDCNMPELDGFEATRAIREREARRPGDARAVPIIALTANALKGDRQRCLDAGMTDYLSKPLNPEKLIATIERHLDAFDGDVANTGELAERSPNDPATPPGAAVFDHQALLHRCLGEPDLLLEIVGDFRRRAADQIRDLEAHLLEGSAPQLISLAHSLKGGAANISAETLREAAEQLEAAGRAGDLDLAKDCLERLKGEWQRFQESVTARYASLEKTFETVS